MTGLDAGQLLLGLVIPPLLISHVLGTAVAATISGSEPSYASVLTVYWVLDPVAGLQQVLVVVAAWIHGCMGLFVWMRIQPWWQRIAGFAYPLVVLIPVAALLGLVEAGKEVIALQDDPAFAATVAAGVKPVMSVFDQLQGIKRNVLIGYGLMVVAVLVARAIRLRTPAGFVRLAYVDGPDVETKAGPTLLELSRMNDVPHASLCGGRGRCGTCRVRVIAGLDPLPKPSPIETETLARIGAEPTVRLACQVAPVGGQSLEVERLLPAYTEPRDLHADRVPVVGFDEPGAVEIAK
jgi:adenylate cyclase